MDLPFRKRRNDSRNVFLKDFLLDKASPAPVKSENENRIDQSIYREKRIFYETPSLPFGFKVQLCMTG